MSFCHKLLPKQRAFSQRNAKLPVDKGLNLFIKVSLCHRPRRDLHDGHVKGAAIEAEAEALCGSPPLGLHDDGPSHGCLFRSNLPATEADSVSCTALSLERSTNPPASVMAASFGRSIFIFFEEPSFCSLESLY